MYAEVELPTPIVVPPLILHLKRLVPTKRDRQISFFHRIDHLIKQDAARKLSVASEPQSLKCQATRAVLKRQFGDAIATLPIPNDLKEQLVAQEQIMNAYFNDIWRCLKNGFDGIYQSNDSNYVFDILKDFAQQKSVSEYFLGLIKKIEKLDDIFFSKGIKNAYNQNIGTVGEILISDAVKANNTNFVAWLLKQGVSANSDDNAHWKTSILTRTVQSGNYALAKILIAYGANVNCVCYPYAPFAGLHSPVTPLLEAVERGREDLVELLLLNNAEVAKPIGCQKQTALHHAFAKWQKLNVKIPILLLKYGCPVDVQDIWLRTPLMHASENVNLPAVQLLLLADANVNACDNCGKTPLMLAAQCVDQEKQIVPVLDTLITYNANINALDNDNASVIDHALESYKRRRDSGYSTTESENVINFLLSKKPKVKIATKMGLLYHLNRNKIWAVGASASIVGLGISAYLYFKKNNLIT